MSPLINESFAKGQLLQPWKAFIQSANNRPLPLCSLPPHQLFGQINDSPQLASNPDNHPQTASSSIVQSKLFQFLPISSRIPRICRRHCIGLVGRSCLAAIQHCQQCQHTISRELWSSSYDSENGTWLHCFRYCKQSKYSVVRDTTNRLLRNDDDDRWASAAVLCREQERFPGSMFSILVREINYQQTTRRRDNCYSWTQRTLNWFK